MTTTTTTDYNNHTWSMQFYDEEAEGFVVPEIGTNNNTAVITTSSPHLTTSPSSSHTAGSGPIMKAQNMSANPKPIRRRSRASKRTPTTLLNANTTNFRALVQQFTGCPSKTTVSFGLHKGPITLNFQQGKTTTSSRPQVQFVETTPFHHQPQQADRGGMLLQPQQLVQNNNNNNNNNYDQNTTTSFGYSNSNNNHLVNSMEISDGLLLDHNFSLHDLLQ